MRSAVWLVAGAALLAATAGGVLGWTQGWRPYVVRTGSMVPALHPGDALLLRPATTPPQHGELLTFGVRGGQDRVVTHRVVDVTPDGITTKGDANRTADPWTVPYDRVVGRPELVLPRLGMLLVYLQQPAGIASLVTVLLGLVLLWQVCFPAARDGRPVVVPRPPAHPRWSAFSEAHRSRVRLAAAGVGVPDGPALRPRGTR